MKTFDLTTVYHKDRPLSWSAISSFEWKPSEWHARYVLKKEIEPSPELLFGSYVDKKIQKDPKFLPNLVRYPVEQHEMRTEIKVPKTVDEETGKVISPAFTIPLVGYADAYRPELPALRDYKTGRKPWDKKRADETGQLTMYALMLYLEHKIRPEDVEFYIDWMPTHVHEGKIAFIKERDIRTFKTKRTMKQVLEFGQRIKDTWLAMEEYAARQADVVPHVKVKRPVSRLLK